MHPVESGHAFNAAPPGHPARLSTESHTHCLQQNAFSAARAAQIAGRLRMINRSLAERKGLSVASHEQVQVIAGLADLEIICAMMAFCNNNWRLASNFCAHR